MRVPAPHRRGAILMCGIAGIVAPPGETADPSWSAGLLSCIEHRGPDGHGWLAWDPSGARSGRDPGLPAARTHLLHRRLAIIDLTNEGWQPMSTPDGRYHIVFNGEIYNYIELRAELEQLGHRFRSNSDTEVLLQAFAEWGAACLPRLVGMFAFALLDAQAGRLVLARDFFGIKPLYYTSLRGRLVFASEMKALLGLPGFRPTLGPGRAYQYLRFGVADFGGRTLVDGIRQLAAAHYLEIDLDAPGASPEPVRYWSLRPRLREDLTFDDAARDLRDLFLDSVRLHLRSDVPVGVALSGGIDSSALLASMRYLEGPSLELHAFSYVAADKRLSEEPWIDCAVAAAGATVHKTSPSAQDLAGDLDQLITGLDEPFRTTSTYAQYRVFRLAREAGIKVTLDGQGADETLAGYRPYVSARIASCVKHGNVREAANLATRAGQLPGSSRRSLMLQAGGHLLPRPLQGRARSLAGVGLKPAWLNISWFESRGIRAGDISAPPGRDVLRATLRHEITTTSLPGLLRFEDRTSMAHSVESRVPFLTPRLVEFCLGLPESYLVTADGTSKAVFRAAMRGIVPDAILDRRDKVGFETPELQWLRALDPWVATVLSSDGAQAVTPLNLEALTREWHAVATGARPFGNHIWRCLNLIRWADLLGVRVDG